MSWQIKYYNDREIKTSKDLLWMAEEVAKAFKSGNVELKDKIALAELKKIYKEHLATYVIPEPIKNRFEILDL